MGKLLIILLIFLSSCYPKELWVKRNTYTCLSIKESTRYDQAVWVVRWRDQDGQIVYEYMNTKPDFKPGYIHSGFIIH